MPGLLFLAWVIAELYVVVLVASTIGVLDTVALMILVSLVGAALVKRAGLGVLRRAQATIAEGGTPHKEVIDGLLLLVAGVLLAIPGFITDAIGVLLLLPPVRFVLRARMIRGFRDRTAFTVRFVDGFGRIDIRGGGSGSVYDASASEVTDDPPRRPELGA